MTPAAAADSAAAAADAMMIHAVNASTLGLSDAFAVTFANAAAAAAPPDCPSGSEEPEN